MLIAPRVNDLDEEERRKAELNCWHFKNGPSALSLGEDRSDSEVRPAERTTPFPAFEFMKGGRSLFRRILPRTMV